MHNFTLSLYTYFFLYKKVPECIFNMFNCSKRNYQDQDISYQEIVDHFEELNDQVKYQLSLKNMTTSTLVGQLTAFKTGVLQSNWQDEYASIEIVVDEIWSTFDIEGDGILDKPEVKRFVQEYMPIMRPGFRYSDKLFEKIFAEVDDDDSHNVDKQEMNLFIRKMLSQHMAKYIWEESTTKTNLQKFYKLKEEFGQNTERNDRNDDSVLFDRSQEKEPIRVKAKAKSGKRKTSVMVDHGLEDINADL